MRKGLILVWADGGSEEVTPAQWWIRDGLLCLHLRQGGGLGVDRYIPLSALRGFWGPECQVSWEYVAGPGPGEGGERT